MNSSTKVSVLPFSFFVTLPSELQRKIFSDLSTQEHGSLTQVNKQWHECANDFEFWNQFLKTEYQTENGGEAKNNFVNRPETRLDKYLLIDEKGENYLKQSVQDPDRLRYLLNPWGRQAVENGLITIELFLQLSETEQSTFQYLFTEFGWDALQKRLYSVDEFYRMLPEHRITLGRIFIKYGILALEEKLITMEQFLNVPVNERYTLEHVLFRGNGYLAFKKHLITLDQFLAVPVDERSTLRHCLFDKPGGLELLEHGGITLELFLRVPIFDRDEYVEQQIEAVSSRGPMSSLRAASQ